MVDFNSHAHVERDFVWDFSFLDEDISTHTLTWSVTGLLEKIIKILDISTHTLTWSVTYFGRTVSAMDKISTHTLTWSVTGADMVHWQRS